MLIGGKTAIVRCDYHGKPKVKKEPYVTSKKLIGHPESAAICGIKECETVGVVWLRESESRDYDQEQRVFEVYTSSMKVKVL